MKLKGNIREIKYITKKQKNRMFNIFKRYYANVKYKTFIRDLEEKQWVLLLLDGNKSIQGFSTLMLLKTSLDNEPVYAIFSGDTIIEKSYWGKHNFYEVWSEFAINLANKYRNLYWFLVSKGYKTYRIMPRFFKEFYPRYDKETPKDIKKIMDKLAYLKFPKNYNGKSIIHFEDTDRLSKRYAVIPQKELKNPHIQFFLNSNPNYTKGDNLVCLARINKDNLKIGLQMLNNYIRLKRLFTKNV